MLTDEQRDAILALELAWDLSYSKNFERWKRKHTILQMVGEELKSAEKGVSILEVGCARGAILFWLNELYGSAHTLRLVGLDINPHFVRFGKRRKELREVHNLSFFVADGETLPFHDESFKILICSETIEHFPDPEKGLREFYRVLKKGGMALLTTPNAYNAISKLSRTMKKLLGRPVSREAVYHDDPLWAPYGVDRHISTKHYTEWVQLSRKCGFSIEDVCRGSLFFGGPSYDPHRFFIALLLVTDLLLDCFPFTKNFAETIVLKLRKKG